MAANEIDRALIQTLVARERDVYAAANPRSSELHGRADHLFGRVPMTWMNKWVGGFPLYLASARGNRITDVDGHTYIDFALGDTGAMAGHSPRATAAAVNQRMSEIGGITTMLPTEDAEWVAAELCRRFGLPLWSFALSATDANRWAIRLARLVTGRPKILVFSYCYHGTVDETFIVLDDEGVARSRPGNVGPAVDPTVTTRVVEFNDLAAVERELAHGDVAAILTEPALTNIGIVLPDNGFLQGVRDLATKSGSLLMIDETHTISAGPGGMTARDGLSPDVFVIGKSLGGGIASGVYGLTNEVARRVHERVAAAEVDLIDVGGVGGTLAGNALSLAAMRATLEHVLTEDAFTRMIKLATRFSSETQQILDKYDVPWSISTLGARAEYRFTKPAPRSGNESAAAADDLLDEFMHLYMCNRGILMTPFHNMALMCPDTTDTDIDRHSEIFESAVRELVRA